MKDGYRIAYDKANLDLAGKVVEIEQLKRRKGQIEALVQALTAHFSQEEETATSQRPPFSVKASPVAKSERSQHSPVPQDKEWSSNSDATGVETPADPIKARIEQALGKNEAAYNAAESEKPVAHFERPQMFAFVS